MNFAPCFKVFTGQIPFPKFTDVNVVSLISKGERPPKPLGGEELGLRPEVWKLAEDCWNQDHTKRPDVITVFQRFREIFTTGISLPSDQSTPSGGASISPIRRIFRRPSRRNTIQDRINKLDQGSYSESSN